MQFRTKRHVNLDPRTKLLMILLANILLFSYGDQIYLHICTALGILLTMLLGKRRQAVYMIVFCIMIYSMTFLMNFAPKNLASIWGLTILPIIVFMPLFSITYLTITTTEVNEMIAAFQKMKMPAAITTPLIVMFRFFPTLKVELSNIRDAMKLKGVRKNPIKLIEYVYVPLLFLSVKIGEELNVSGLTRGLGLYKTTTQTIEIKASFLDVLVIAAMIALIVLRRGWIAW